MKELHRPKPGGHPGARFGLARGVATVAPLPPLRPSPTRNASPTQNRGCVKVGVSQLRKSGCLLTAPRSGPVPPRLGSPQPHLTPPPARSSPREAAPVCPKHATLTSAVGFRQYIGHQTPNAASRRSCHLPANPLPRLLSLHLLSRCRQYEKSGLGVCAGGVSGSGDAWVRKGP